VCKDAGEKGDVERLTFFTCYIINIDRSLTSFPSCEVMLALSTSSHTRHIHTAIVQSISRLKLMFRPPRNELTACKAIGGPGGRK